MTTATTTTLLYSRICQVWYFSIKNVHFKIQKKKQRTKILSCDICMYVCLFNLWTFFLFFECEYTKSIHTCKTHKSNQCGYNRWRLWWWRKKAIFFNLFHYSSDNNSTARQNSFIIRSFDTFFWIPFWKLTLTPSSSLEYTHTHKH